MENTLVPQVHPGYANVPNDSTTEAAIAANQLYHMEWNMYHYQCYSNPYQMIYHQQWQQQNCGPATPTFQASVYPNNQVCQQIMPYTDYVSNVAETMPTMSPVWPQIANQQPRSSHSEKPRGSRAPYKAAQINILQERFNKSNRIDLKERQQLSSKTGLTPQQIKIWFQNRRFKQRKEALKKGEEFKLGSLNIDD